MEISYRYSEMQVFGFPESGRKENYDEWQKSTQRRPSRSRQLARTAAGSRHAGWLKFNRIDRLEGVTLGLSAEISQISDAIRAGRRRESLSLLGGIVEIGC
jgi:hypothetical protein